MVILGDFRLRQNLDKKSYPLVSFCICPIIEGWVQMFSLPHILTQCPQA